MDDNQESLLGNLVIFGGLSRLSDKSHTTIVSIKNFVLTVSNGFSVPIRKN